MGDGDLHLQQHIRILVVGNIGNDDPRAIVLRELHEHHLESSLPEDLGVVGALQEKANEQQYSVARGRSEAV